MLAELGAVGTRILANSCANVLQKRLTGAGIPALPVNAGVYLVLSVVMIPAAFSGGWHWSAELLSYACCVGICGAAGNGFLVAALETGELSVLGPINAWKPVVGMIGALLLLGELPTAAGMAGLVLTVFGSYFVLGAGQGGFRFRLLLRRDILFRLLALVFTGIEAVFLKKSILLSSVTGGFLIWCWFGALFSLIGVALGRVPLGTGRSLRRRWRGVLLLALMFGLMQYSTNAAFQLLPVGPALALFQLSSAVNLWFGWKFFHERDMIPKIAGTAAILAGAALIILGS